MKKINNKLINLLKFLSFHISMFKVLFKVDYNLFEVLNRLKKN